MNLGPGWSHPVPVVSMVSPGPGLDAGPGEARRPRRGQGRAARARAWPWSRSVPMVSTARSGCASNCIFVPVLLVVPSGLPRLSRSREHGRTWVRRAKRIAKRLETRGFNGRHGCSCIAVDVHGPAMVDHGARGPTCRDERQPLQTSLKTVSRGCQAIGRRLSRTADLAAKSFVTST